MVMNWTLADLPGYNFPSGVKPRRTQHQARVEPVYDDWDAT
jgi:hypothetical protein